jgi:CRP/FNR family transcriptional regulator
MDGVPKPLTDTLRSARLKHFPKGQIVLYEGDVSLDTFILKTGAIKIYDIDDQGNEKILHILKPPAVMPFAFFSGDDEPTEWFYTALTDCDVYVISKSKIRQDTLANNILALYLMHWFSREVHELLVRLSSLGKTNARDKMVAALKFLAVCHATQRRSGWWRVAFPVSHQLLADLVGITRESAAMVMKELQDERGVRNPRLTILEINLPRLRNQGNM